MNITFLIGNGFDVHLGLKTRYTDFYDIYINSNKDTEEENIKNFCGMIEENYETWADFESAFAEKAFGTKDDVKAILSDFSVKFAKYLRGQVQLCDYTDEEIPQKFKDFLINGYKFLETRDRQTIDNKYKAVNANITINFINFNYTNTLNNLIESYKKSNSDSVVLRSYLGSVSKNQCAERIGTTLNIHGTLDNYIIIGIDSTEQLKDESLKNNDAISKYCVKSEINKDAGNGEIENRFVNTINSSRIIYSYGLSFGESDRSRWDVIANWLKSNAENKFIIYKYKTNFQSYDPIYRRLLLDAIEEEKNNYLGLLGFDESEYEKYYDQIFVIDSDNVLDIKLIKDEAGIEQK